MRRLLNLVMITVVTASVLWTGITFFGDSTKLQKDYATNETITVEIPRLMLKSWYPWNPVGSMMVYIAMIVFQYYVILFSMVHANTGDVMFCSWVLFACEQLQHLKVNFCNLNFKFLLKNFCGCKSGHYATIDGALGNIGYIPPQLCCFVPQHFCWLEERTHPQRWFV